MRARGQRRASVADQVTVQRLPRAPSRSRSSSTLLHPAAPGAASAPADPPARAQASASRDDGHLRAGRGDRRTPAAPPAAARRPSAPAPRPARGRGDRRPSPSRPRDRDGAPATARASSRIAASSRSPAWPIITSRRFEGMRLERRRERGHAVRVVGVVHHDPDPAELVDVGAPGIVGRVAAEPAGASRAPRRARMPSPPAAAAAASALATLCRAAPPDVIGMSATATDDLARSVRRAGPARRRRAPRRSRPRSACRRTTALPASSENQTIGARTSAAASHQHRVVGVEHHAPAVPDRPGDEQLRLRELPQVLHPELAQVVRGHVGDDRDVGPLDREAAPEQSAARGLQDRGLHLLAPEHQPGALGSGVVAFGDRLAVRPKTPSVEVMPVTPARRRRHRGEQADDRRLAVRAGHQRDRDLVGARPVDPVGRGQLARRPDEHAGAGARPRPRSSPLRKVSPRVRAASGSRAGPGSAPPRSRPQPLDGGGELGLGLRRAPRPRRPAQAHSFRSVAE